MFKKKSKTKKRDDSADMPDTLPIFPLTGVLLLPRGQLPLNIFEKRYKDMVHDAFQNKRMIGMIQPVESTNEGQTEIHKVGCAGRITQFEEKGPSNYYITLTGVSRFDVKKEVSTDTLYRQVVPDWSKYACDLDLADSPEFCPDQFVKVLRRYFDAMDMTCEKWDDLTGIHPERLVATLAMVCPFSTQEKQALLEAECLEARLNLLIALMEVAARQKQQTTMRH
tara:strand:- start:3775 stop:4446 length:672 start_codon:yes stop_codon:yes gene_type:complete